MIMEENTTFKEEHTTRNIGMDEYEEQTIHCSPNDSIKNRQTLNDSENICSNDSSTNKIKAIWNKIKMGIRVKNEASTTYTKRNPIVNALLTIYVCIIVCISLLGLNSAVLMLFTGFNDGYFILGIAYSYYSLFCAYYTYKFIIGNRKDAIFPAFIGSTFVWMVFITIIVMIFVPDHVFRDVEKNKNCDLYIFTIILIISLISNSIIFFVIYLIMRIKKYGATAWTLLERPRGKKSQFNKICIAISLIIWILPVGEMAYSDYKSKHPEDKYPLHSTAKIGDYYYADGTVSSELLPDKKPIGIVFSRECSEKDKIMGYNHGQIVSLTDISSSKMQWNQEPKDYELYPNYVWENRMDALKDIDGLEYTNCEEFSTLQINWDSMKYMEDEVKGASEWYVPTAGQWTKILENLGKVKVDRMLKFDAETACKNLKKADIDPLRWYWTITEFDAENAWSIRVASGEFGSRTNKQSKAYVRPVASF